MATPTAEPHPGVGVGHYHGYRSLPSQENVEEICQIPGVDALFFGPVRVSPCREFCHFADALSPPLLMHLLKVEGGAAD